MKPKGPYICPICKKWSCSLIGDCEDCIAYGFENGEAKCNKFDTFAYGNVECDCNPDDVKIELDNYILKDQIKLYEAQLNDLHTRLRDINKVAHELLMRAPSSRFIIGSIEHIIKRSKT